MWWWCQQTFELKCYACIAQEQQGVGGMDGRTNGQGSGNLGVLLRLPAAASSPQTTTKWAPPTGSLVACYSGWCGVSDGKRRQAKAALLDCQ